MRKLFLAAVFIGVGSGLYWLASRTAQFSFKKWDSRFESVLRSSLSTVGLKNEDILSSLNILKTDKNGEWVTKQLTLRLSKPDQIESVKREIEKSGAEVTQTVEEGLPTLVVKRGTRIYQEIRFRKS